MMAIIDTDLKFIQRSLNSAQTKSKLEFMMTATFVQIHWSVLSPKGGASEPEATPSPHPPPAQQRGCCGEDTSPAVSPEKPAELARV